MLSGLFASFIATKLGKLLPSWAWEIVIAALLVGAGMLAHHVAVVRHDNTVRATQKAADDKATEAQLAKLRAVLTQKNAQLAAMASQLRKANDEENRRIAADAADLRLRGPGKATCPRLPEAPAASGGTGNGGAGDAPVGPLPDAGGQQLIALPFDDSTYFAADHDYWRERALKWDSWYDNLVKAWPKAK